MRFHLLRVFLLLVKYGFNKASTSVTIKEVEMRVLCLGSIIKLPVLVLL
jgi:hypothetical protein